MKRAKTPQAITPANDSHETRILNAATAVFLEKGYEETSTAEIARRARVSKRELYANFRDKRDILAAVVSALQGDMQSQANISWSSDDELQDVLFRVGTQILDFIHSEKFAKLLRIVAAESFRDPIPAQKFYLLGPGRGRQDTAAFFKRRMKAGQLRTVNPMQAADDYLALLFSAQEFTATVLGQDYRVSRTGPHVRHAIEVFLAFYGVPAARKAAPRAKPGRRTAR